MADVLYFADAFGSGSCDTCYRTVCDFNGDGSTDVVDLLIMVDNFGK